MNSSVLSPVQKLPDGYQIRLPEEAFVALLAAFITLVFIPGMSRLAFRLYSSRRLFLDDYLVLFAILCLAPAGALTHSVADQIYLQIYVGIGAQQAPPDFFASMLVFEKRILVCSVLVWAALYAIKFSFLVFFRRLIDRAERLIRLWWCVVALTALCAVASLPLGFIVCPHLDADYMTYCPVPMQLANERIYLIATTTMDVLTDVLILVVPMLLLLPLQLALRRKLAVMGMMSLSVFMIVIAIVRFAGATLPNGVIDTAWLVFWQGMESAVAVLMVSLLVIKSIFTTEHAKHDRYKHRYDPEKGATGSSASNSHGSRHRHWLRPSSLGRRPSPPSPSLLDHAPAQICAWDPAESFAPSQEACCKPVSVKTASWRLAPGEVRTEISAVPRTSQSPHRSVSVDDLDATALPAQADSRRTSTRSSQANARLMSKYYHAKSPSVEITE